MKVLFWQNQGHKDFNILVKENFHLSPRVFALLIHTLIRKHKSIMRLNNVQCYFNFKTTVSKIILNDSKDHYENRRTHVLTYIEIFDIFDVVIRGCDCVYDFKKCLIELKIK